jgi:hypothetical protein
VLHVQIMPKTLFFLPYLRYIHATLGPVGPGWGWLGWVGPLVIRGACPGRLGWVWTLITSKTRVGHLLMASGCIEADKPFPRTELTVILINGREKDTQSVVYRSGNRTSCGTGYRKSERAD